MRVLLDTAVLLFAVHSPERISKKAAAVLKNPHTIREVSSISMTEIAIKTSLGKLELSPADLNQAIDDLDVRILPFTADHAFRLFELAPLHRDPFDRQIIAQALCESIPLITPDAQMRIYEDLTTLW